MGRTPANVPRTRTYPTTDRSAVTFSGFSRARCRAFAVAMSPDWDRRPKCVRFLDSGRLLARAHWVSRMDAALGPPEKMAEQSDELTPMMSQYFELCERYDDSLVLFQVGDFYETFCEAAETTARLLEITLTQREDSTGEYPMSGIPIDNAESYIETLLDAGYRVAVADQVQDPEETTGVVDRAVTRVVTPGTLTEDELLDTDDNNFVACLTADPDRYGLALLDVSTGDFYATSARREAAVADEVSRFAPAEAIVEPEIGAATTDV